MKDLLKKYQLISRGEMSGYMYILSGTNLSRFSQVSKNTVINIYQIKNFL